MPWLQTAVAIDLVREAGLSFSVTVLKGMNSNVVKTSEGGVPHGFLNHIATTSVNLHTMLRLTLLSTQTQQHQQPLLRGKATLSISLNSSV